MKIFNNTKIKDKEFLKNKILSKYDIKECDFHETTIKANTKEHIHYQNQLKAVYCIGGNGRIENLDTDEVYELYNGAIHTLNKHDNHNLYGGTKDMKMIYVFNSLSN